MKRIGLFVVMIFSIVCLKAEKVEKMTLKNGSVLEGYLYRQQPGKDLVFVAEESTLVIPSEKVSSIVEKDVALDNLSKAWQDWVALNPGHVKQVNEKSYITLCDIFVKDKSLQTLPDSLISKYELDTKKLIPAYHNVRMIERGNHVKFLDCSNVSHHIAWDKVEQIERKVRDNKLLSGLVDEFYLRNGRIIKGQVVKTVVGTEISVLDDNQMTHVISLQDIGWHKKTAFNSEQPLLEQTLFLDVIVTTAGKEIEGLVVTQNYGTESEEGYLSIIKHDSSVERVNVGMIKEMRKLINVNYRPLEDVEINGAEMFVSRKPVQMATIEEKNDMGLIAKKSPVLELSLDSIQHELVVEQLDMPDHRNLILFKLINVKVSREMRKAFTFEDLLMYGATPNKESVSANKTLKQVFPLKEKGDYILYRTKKREVFYIIVK